MKKVILNIVVVIIIAILILIQEGMTFAASQSDLNNVNNKIEEKKEELNEIKTEKSSTMQEVEKLTSQISSYQQQIDELDEKISEYDNKINEAQEKLNKAQEDYNKQENLLEARLVATYEAGETSYLDFLLSSSSITDLISNYYLVTEVANNDAELLESIKKQKQEIENAKETLENSKKDLATSKSTKQSVSTQLQSAKKQKNEQVAKLSEDEKQVQAELQQFEADKASIRAEIAAASKKYPSKPSSGGGIGSSSSGAGGFMRPVSGAVTCGFYGYSGHTGIDYGAGYGQPVLASKGGVVYRSKTTTGGIPNYGSNGSYVGSFSSYGEYIIIDHQDGTMTLYAHGKPGSRLVSVGQTVSKGQQIMSVGNTGNVYPRPTPSSPLNGTHLHFEIWVNGTPVNPANYV